MGVIVKAGSLFILNVRAVLSTLTAILALLISATVIAKVPVPVDSTVILPLSSTVNLPPSPTLKPPVEFVEVPEVMPSVKAFVSVS